MKRVIIMLILIILSLFTGGTLWAAGETPMAVKIMEGMEKIPGGSLWPDFNPNSYPVAFFDGENTLLFRHPAPPEGFEKGPDGDGMYIYSGRHPVMRAHSTAPLGDVVCATVLLDDCRGKSAAQVTSLAVHELFHVFQKTKPGTWNGNTYGLSSYPVDNIDNYAGVLMETQVLHHALTANKQKETLGWLKTYLEMRGRRVETVLKNHGTLEKVFELYEGLAFYVEHSVLGDLKAVNLLEQEEAPEKVRLRAYPLGLAKARLLDRLLPGWKKPLDSENVKDLDQLLKQAVDANPAEALRLNPETVENFSKAAKKAMLDLKKRRLDMKNGVLNKEGYSVHIIVKPGTKPLRIGSYDPMNFIEITTGEELHQRMFQLGNDTGLARMLNPRWKPGKTEGINALINIGQNHDVSKAIYTGLTSDPVVEVKGKAVKISTKGLDIEFNHAELQRRGKQIKVFLTAPQK